MPKLLLATDNRGKLRELGALISSDAWELTTAAREGIAVHVQETGKTFEENAAIKAIAYAKAANLVAIADDSGLEVEALHGEPGVLSAHYGVWRRFALETLRSGVPLPPRLVTLDSRLSTLDRERADHLLANIAGVPWEKRSACFRCVIAIATPEGEVELCSGECRGFIALESKGENGFGYDPIFYLPEFGKTMAELSFEEKNRVSHRGKAAREARLVLERLPALAADRSRK